MTGGTNVGPALEEAVNMFHNQGKCPWLCKLGRKQGPHRTMIPDIVFDLSAWSLTFQLVLWRFGQNKKTLMEFSIIQNFYDFLFSRATTPFTGIIDSHHLVITGRSGDVAKYLMILSDGESRFPERITAAMSKIKAANIKTFAIGVGAGAKSPKSRYGTTFMKSLSSWVTTQRGCFLSLGVSLFCPIGKPGFAPQCGHICNSDWQRFLWSYPREKKIVFGLCLWVWHRRTNALRANVHSFLTDIILSLCLLTGNNWSKLRKEMGSTFSRLRITINWMMECSNR